MGERVPWRVAPGLGQGKGLRYDAAVFRVIVTSCLTMCVALPVRAAPEGRGSPSTSIPGYAEAEALYERGKARYQTADYDGAIGLWTEAYGSLPDQAETSHIKTLLMYDIARAHEEAFAVDGSVARLRQAKILFERYRESIPQLYPDARAAKAEREQVDERIEGLDGRIAAASADDAQDPSAATSGDDRVRDGRRLVIAGATVGALGVAGIGLMTAGLVIGQQANDISDLDPGDAAGRREQFDRGRTGNVLAIVGGAVGGALLAASATMLAIGLSRRTSATTAVAPVVGPGFAGGTVRASF